MRNGSLRIVLVMITLSAPALGGGTGAGRPPGWTPERMLTVAAVTGVAPSPDGKRVAYAVRTAEMGPGRSEFVTRLHLAEADGSGSKPLAQSAASASDPQWAPDGSALAFLGPHLGKNTVWLLPLEGGTARPLTDSPTAVTAFAWSPDGKRIAFAMADPPTAEEERARKDRDDAYWFNEGLKNVHLHILAAGKEDKDAKPRRLTRGAFSVQPDFQWTPDGSEIAFTHTRGPRVDDWRTADVSVVDTATGKIRPIAASEAAESAPHYSPDGKWIALLASGTPPAGLEDIGIRIVSADGKAVKDRVATPDRRPNLIGWDAAGERVLFLESQGTVTRLFALHVASGAVTPFSPADVMEQVRANRAGTALAFTLQGPHRPPEVYVSPVERFAPVQVSRINAALPDLPLGKVEAVRWKSKDGLEIEGLLTYPVGYRPGKHVPLLVVIHGGPAGVFSRRYLANPQAYPLAAFAARGFAILQPNPRGSTGYGLKFRRANSKDWGGGDYQDVMAGVDHLVARGVADPERLGVMGWSFGGYLTAWTITQTRRFKAASVGAGVTDLVSQAGTTDMPSHRLVYFGAWPWDEPDFYAARSPVLRAKGVTTPTLIQHGELDRRVPIGQGYELYNALRQQGVPVRMLVLPRQGHAIGEPRLLLKVMQTNLDWFEKHVAGAAR